MRRRLAIAIRDLRDSNNSRARAARGAIGTMIAQVAGLGLTFVAQFLLVRLAGPVGYGDYTYALAWLSTAGLLCTFGADTALVRFVAEYLATASWRDLRGVLRWAIRLTACVSGGLSIVAVGLVLVVPSLPSGLLGALLCGIPLIPAQAFAQLSSAALRALDQTGRSRIPDLVLRPLLLLGGCMLLATASTDVTGVSLMGVHVGTMVLTVGLVAWWISRITPLDARVAPPSDRGREWLSVAWPLLLVASTQIVISQMDTILVGSLIDTKAAGIYAVASRLAGLVSFVLTAAVSICSPMVSALHSERRTEELRDLVASVSVATVLATAPIVVGLVMLAGFILSSFDPAFAAGRHALIILTVGQACNVLGGMSGSVLSMTGNQRVVARTLAGGAALNVALNVALIPRFQLEGAAIATAASVAAWNVSLALHVRKRIRLSTVAFWPHPKLHVS